MAKLTIPVQKPAIRIQDVLTLQKYLVQRVSQLKDDPWLLTQVSYDLGKMTDYLSLSQKDRYRKIDNELIPIIQSTYKYCILQMAVDSIGDFKEV